MQFVCICQYILESMPRLINYFLIFLVNDITRTSEFFYNKIKLICNLVQSFSSWKKKLLFTQL